MQGKDNKGQGMKKLIYRGHELDLRICFRIQNDQNFKKMFDDCLDDLYQPERSKREDLNCNCHRCFQDNLLKNHYPWVYQQEMIARDGKILCEKIQDAVL